MKKILFIFCMLYKLSFANVIVFESDDYRIEEKLPKKQYDSLILTNKLKSTTQIIEDCTTIGDKTINLSKAEINSQGIKFNFLKIFPDDISKDGKYLRVPYDEIGNVYYSESDYEQHIMNKCSIIDLPNAKIIATNNARNDVCAKENYLDFIFPDIGFPIKELSLANFLKNNNDFDEYTVQKYKNMLRCYKKVRKNILHKVYLYTTPNQKTKMYLIKGDKVTILHEQIDDSNQKWYFINYKGKKDLKMWIKAEAVDITDGD